MKIKHIISIIGSVAMGLSLQSCKDFLTQTNPNTLTTDQFYLNLTDCNYGLNAIYSSYRNMNNFSPVEESLRSDLAVQGAKVNRTNFTNVFYLQTFTNSENQVINKWSSYYRGIYRANQLFEGIESVRELLTSDDDLAELQSIEAQAYMLRGTFYFWLSTTFNGGEVPYLDYVSHEEADYYNICEPRLAIIEYYRNDLRRALELGLSETWDDSNLGRVTAWGAKAILGKSYLYEEDYETAREYFKDIIDNGGFSLTECIGDNFSSLTEYNSESIMEVSYDDGYNTEFANGNDSAVVNNWGMQFSCAGTNASTIPSFWLVDEFEDERVDELNPRCWVEMESDNYRSMLDTTGEEDLLEDVIYNQGGISYEYEDYSEDGTIFYHHTYVYHAPAASYTNTVYERTISYDAETGEILESTDTDPNPLYTTVMSESSSYLWFNNDLEIKWEGGVAYRKRMFSPRASYSMVLSGDEELLYYMLPIQQTTRFGSSETGYFRKFTNWDIRLEEEDGTPTESSAINLRLIRLADVYLMYAEALVEGGYNNANLSEALKYVNRVRERAGTTLLGSSVQSFAEYSGTRTYESDLIADGEEIDMIDTAEELMLHLMYKERPLELCIEGNAIRVKDLRRWGVTKSRFQSLATAGYAVYGETKNLAPTDTNDQALTLQSVYGDQMPIEEAPSGTTAKYDYVHASINYGDSKAYLPIPSMEESSNPLITE